MKRFWTQAVDAETAPGHFTVLLDGKPARRPDGVPLSLPSRHLAAAAAAEWDAAPASFTPDDLPLTRLAVTAAERIGPNREDIIRQLAAYGMNDLLCYRAEDDALAAHEAQAWQPWLDWAATQTSITLAITTGIKPVIQPPAAETAFRSILAAMNDGELAGLGVIVPALGSLILSLALAAGTLLPEEACRLSQLDELWQEQRWGRDDEALARRELILSDVVGSLHFMVLCRP